MNKHKFVRFFDRIVLGCITLILISCNTNRISHVSIVLDSNDVVANAQESQWALGQLTEALEDQSVKSTVYANLEDAPENDLFVIV